MRPIRSSALSTARLAELDRCYRGAPEARVRIRALMVLLAAERGMVAAEIAVIVRQHEETVRRWLVRYRAEGPAGLADVVRVGAPPEGRPPIASARRPPCAGAHGHSGCRSRSGRAGGWPTTSPSGPGCA